MNQGLALLESEVETAASPASAPTFLIESEPWHEVFLSNLASQFANRRQSRDCNCCLHPASFGRTSSSPSPLPWARFLESICYHAAFITAIL